MNPTETPSHPTAPGAYRFTREPIAPPYACPSCGAVHASWESLEYVGVQIIEADEEGPELRLELRNCSACKSTLSREVAS